MSGTQMQPLRVSFLFLSSLQKILSCKSKHCASTGLGEKSTDKSISKQENVEILETLDRGGPVPLMYFISFLMHMYHLQLFELQFYQTTVLNDATVHNQWVRCELHLC